MIFNAQSIVQSQQGASQVTKSQVGNRLRQREGHTHTRTEKYRQRHGDRRPETEKYRERHIATEKQKTKTETDRDTHRERHSHT